MNLHEPVAIDLNLQRSHEGHLRASPGSKYNFKNMMMPKYSLLTPQLLTFSQLAHEVVNSPAVPSPAELPLKEDVAFGRILLTWGFRNDTSHPAAHVISNQLRMAVGNLTAAGTYAQGSVYNLQREPL